MMPRRMVSSRGVKVFTAMPGATGVVQEAGDAVAPLDLDEAEAAGAEGLETVGGAELGNLDADLPSPRA